MTKEALKLALEALEKCYGYRNHEWMNEAITAIKEALAQTEPNYKKALEVWLDKTEWVQETVKPHELGMHRADVLKQRIEEALAKPEQHQDWCASLTQMLMSMPPKPAPCNCKPKPEQEPCCYGGIAHDCHAGEGCRIVKRMKTAQKTPQRPWIGLTDEEIKNACDKHTNWFAIALDLEAKLKEKNT